jgi:hypothetical protein
VPLVSSFQQLIQLSQECLDLAPINLPVIVKFFLAVNGMSSIANRRTSLFEADEPFTETLSLFSIHKEHK